ncbi:MAG: hypothetical protein ACI807_001585 [Paracoccaceae bacterium]|jgi:hypothetical protein
MTTGSRVTVSGGGLSRVLRVQDGADARLSHLIVLDGQTDGFGGGIQAETNAALDLDGVTVAASHALWGGGISITQTAATLGHVTNAGNAAALGTDLAGDGDSFAGLDAARVALGSAGVLTDTYTPTALAGMTVADPATLFAGFDGAAPVLADKGGPVKTVAPPPIPPSLVVTTLLDVIDASDGVQSLREAIALAESGAAIGTITFDLSTTAYGGVLMSGGNILRVLRVADGGDAAITNMTFQLGYDAENGGAVLIEGGGALALDHVRVLSSEAGGDGGGIFLAAKASLIGRDLVVAENEASAGGGINVVGTASADIAFSTISGNVGGVTGGLSVFDTSAPAWFWPMPGWR